MSLVFISPHSLFSVDPANAIICIYLRSMGAVGVID